MEGSETAEIFLETHGVCQEFFLNFWASSSSMEVRGGEKEPTKVVVALGRRRSGSGVIVGVWVRSVKRVPEKDIE